jgi:putative ABC transport system permease protein
MLRSLLRTLLTDVAIGARSGVRHTRRMSFAIAAVAFGIVALVLSGAFIDWVLWATREGSIQSGLGHLQIVRPGFTKGGLAEPFKYLLPSAAPELEMLEGRKGVRTVAPRLSFSGLVSKNESTVSFIGEGVVPEREEKFSTVSIIIAGEDISPADPTGVIVGRGLAANLDVAVGDKIVLLVNTSTGGINASEVRVRGLFATVNKAYDDAAIRVPMGVAQPLLRTTGVHRWIVVLDKTELTPGFLAGLQGRLPEANFEVVPWWDLADFYKKTVQLLSQQMAFVRLIVAAIIVLGISNTLVMNVMERTSEIGTLMAVGTTRAGILRQFLSEGVMVGIIGSTAGLAIGLTLAWLISWIGIPMPPPPGQTQGYTARLLISAGLVGQAALIGFATALLASLYPAWKGSRLVIVDALRHGR